MPSPRVSVIITCYNTAPFVSETLDSALAQTFRDFELIVVNDGSPDTAILERVLVKYREQIVYIVQENKGVAGARNAALEVCRGELVATLDSDDRWHREYLATLVAKLDASPELAVVYSDARRFDDTGYRGHPLSEDFNPRGPITFSRVLNREVQVYAFATARTEILRRLGGYDEDLRTGEDFDLWLRLLKAGYRIAFIDRLLVDYRIRAGSLTADSGRQERGIDFLLQRLAKKLTLTQEEAKIIAAHRKRLSTSINLLEGRAALALGDTRTARTKFRAAFQTRKGWKLGAVLVMLTIAPWGAVRVAQFRKNSR